MDLELDFADTDAMIFTSSLNMKTQAVREFTKTDLFDQVLSGV